MSVVCDVLERARAGSSAERIAAQLGVDHGLVRAILDEGVRMGLVVPARNVLDDGCSGCVPPEQRRIACIGCVFAVQ